MRLRFILSAPALLASFMLFAGTGCTTTKQPLLTNYSESLYACRKNPSAETLEKHRQTLEGVVTEAGARNVAVPPGVFIELGYINLKAGNAEEARKYFKAESDLYPESKVFANRLIAMTEETSKPDAPATDAKTAPAGEADSASETGKAETGTSVSAKTEPARTSGGTHE